MSGMTDEPTTSSSSDEFESEMLRQLFRKCDSEIRTGQVRSVDLINAIQDMTANESTDRRMVEKLSTLMDPKSDNAYLTEDEFVAVGRKWMACVKESRNEETENRPELPNVPKLRRPLIGPGKQFKRPSTYKRSSAKPAKPLQTLKQDYHLHSDSSLGLLDLDEVTFSDPDSDVENNLDDVIAGSNRYFRRGAEAQRNRDRMDALSNELEELRKSNQRLFDEKTNLQSQFLVTEDNICLLQKENDDLKVQLKSLEQSCEMRAALESKLNRHNELFLQNEEKVSSLQENLSNYRDISDNLTIENSRLKEELDKCQESLSIARLNCNDSCVAVDELTKELDRLKLDMADQVITLREMTKERTILTFKLSETQQINERLETEIEQCKSQLAMGQESTNNWETSTASVNPEQLFDVSEISFDKPEDFDQVFKTDANEVKRHPRKPGPSAFSTPFNQNFIRPVRGSIGEEIKKLGLGGSPLCDKTEKVDTTDCCTQTDPPIEMENPVASVVDKDISDVYNLSSVKVIAELPIIESRRSPKVLFMSGITILALLAIFTFFGGVEYGDRTLYPVTWSPEYGFPEPFVVFSFKPNQQPNVW